ncbi:MAG TPA: biotin/lipoyl-containing protein [Thermoanaerobaculia bacterium]|jgi:biotin carboxyl carrier protein
MTAKIVTIAGEEPREVETGGVEIVAMRGNEAELRVGGRTYVVPFVVQGGMVHFSFDGEIYAAEVADKGARGRGRAREHSMAAPMPGVVLKILVAKGDVVSKGTPLIVLEAMKMEHQIMAPRDGTVVAIHCKEGELVQPGVDLVTLS